MQSYEFSNYRCAPLDTLRSLLMPFLVCVTLYPTLSLRTNVKHISPLLHNYQSINVDGIKMEKTFRVFFFHILFSPLMNPIIFFLCISLFHLFGHWLHSPIYFFVYTILVRVRGTGGNKPTVFHISDGHRCRTLRYFSCSRIVI